ncbi:MAG TPA: protein kinase [Ktedonobacteraceae bacterium]|nr:protein kinase [Ktedonobacteraceae bacterium]
MANQEENFIGQQFGNYRLVNLLGQGGFADVYLGEHIHLKTQAAIKILRTRLASDDREKFLNEARTIAHLEHPNIIRVWDFGIERGLPYLVMTRAVNGTLRQLYPKGSQLTLAEIMPYVKQVANALHYAHAQHLVHRDVKPENMLLGKNQEVLLSDFGIAAVMQSSHYQSTQDVVGTVAYMAPEQLQGKPSPASDQYSLAIVVYEWLCGERPFQGSFLEIFGQHMSAPPPSLCERNPAIPLAVEQAVFVALAKNPQDRFGNIRAFANALENALAEADTSTFVSPRPSTPPPGAIPASQPVSGSHPNAPAFVNAPQPTPPPGLIPASLSSISTVDINAPTFVSTPQQPAPGPGFTPIPPSSGSSPQLSPSSSSPSGSTPPPGVYGKPAEAPMKPAAPKSALSTLLKVLSLILVIVIIAVGTLVGISLARQRMGNTGSPSSGTQGGTSGQSPTLPAPTATSPAFTPASNTTPVPTLPPTTPLTVSNPALPLVIKCVSCSYPGLSLSLIGISANAANSTTLWVFTIANDGASQCSRISFSNLQLEDENGTQYQTSGQASDSWSLNAGTSTNESPTIALIPQAGIIYTLNVSLSANCTNGDNIYQTENMQFEQGPLTGQPVPSTALTPKTPGLPLTISCVQCNYPKLTLALTSITANSSGSTTVWHFVIANNGASACNRISFSNFQLEDPSGTQYQTSGQVSDNWSLNSGTQVEESPTLALIPQPGVTYTLNITLSAEDCTNGDNVYQTENIQF